ncbi:MAG: CidA/LrgA family protein [bacterium]|nr:CidA/LrgA family protein [bacterium]
MKYLQQLAIIVTINFIGEILNHFIPLPVPASVYGLVILFICLCTGIVKVHQVDDVARFLLAIMPIMFLAPNVSIINSFAQVKEQAVSLVIIAFVSMMTVMAVTSLTAQWYIRLKRKHRKTEAKEDE